MQFNLFNSTIDDILADRVIIYDGDIYNETTKTIVELNSTSTYSNHFIKTQGTRLSVQLHATGASGNHGFVAEIVTLPVSTIGIGLLLIFSFVICFYFRYTYFSFFEGAQNSSSDSLQYFYSL